jgi:hypothetical protein
METKIDHSLNNDQIQPSQTPVFDIDDLGFFRFYGLGLRHVELELGIREAKLEKNCGDAVSLACYGREPKNWNDFSFDSTLCGPFQEKVEEFILMSYEVYHNASTKYNDAAFSLIIRGVNARCPYDFGNYPLGKCGKKEFSAAQVMSLMTTESNVNDDINHAVYNTLMRLKEVCRQLKLEKAKELLKLAPPELHDLIRELMEHYQNDVFLKKPFFLIINRLCDSSNIFLPELDDLIEKGEMEPSVLKTWMQEVDKNQKKGVNTINILYQPDDFSSMDTQTLSKRLCHYIKNQNLEKVQLCIQYFSKSNFNPENDNNIPNPLQVAAHEASMEILKAIYEFAPEQYDLLIENKNLTTPIFVAAYYGRMENFNYLLSVRPLIARDISFFNEIRQREEHLFLGLAESRESASYEIMLFLASKGVGYGFEFDNNELHGNPLSMITQLSYEGEINKKKFELLLPHANAKSKYLGILSATLELYYCYEHGHREKMEYKTEYFADRINQLFEYRNNIFASLSKEECEEIRTIVQSKVSFNYRAEEILIDDLKFEIKGNPDEKVVANIQACFDLASYEKKDQISVTKVNTTMFQQKPVIRNASTFQANTLLLNYQVEDDEENSCCTIS